LEAANDDLKTSKIALEDAYERLLHLDRMKSDFVANVSHELRTPLTSIKSYTEILYDEIEELDVDEQRRFLGIIDREADRLTRLICDLLDLRKMESGEMSWRDKELDIAGLIEETIHDCRSYASSRGTKISLQVEGDMPMIFIDRDKIKQVTTNLLSNAIKFSPEGDGEVEVSIDMLGDISGDMSTEEVKGACNKSDIVVSVRDYGVGIEEGDLDNLFNRFYQGKSSESVAKTAGTGLGLSISRDIVEHYGGRIWAESILGDGATFRFSLPVSVADKTLGTNR
jgi:signal transduction histidine kinase